MNLSQIRLLVKRGESEDLEFKKTTSGLSDAMHTVCAFLNSTTGGTVLFGVTDDKKVTGQEISDGTKKNIATELSKLEPHVDQKVNYIHVSGDRYIIAIVVSPGAMRPYVYNGCPYIRSQSTTRIMPQEKYAQLLQNRRQPSIAWESLIDKDCSINDLDKKRIKKIVGMAVAGGRLPGIATNENVNEVLKKFNLMVGHQLTNAAVILFCKNEQKQFIQSMVKLARFKGTDKTEFIDNKAIRGNIFDLYETATAFLDTYLPIAGKIEVDSHLRVDSPAIPIRVLREALINAFCHRDYSSRGGSIDIAIYDDHVEIANIGPLPADITIDELSKKHRSFPRNPLIANVLYACGMIERWGRGTLDMIMLCKQSGNKPPKFEESTGGFSVTFPFKEPISRILIAPKSPVLLTDRQQAIINLLRQSPLSRKQIVSKMKNKLTDRMVQVELAKLKKLGLIAPEGKARAIVWVIIGK